MIDVALNRATVITPITLTHCTGTAPSASSSVDHSDSWPCSDNDSLEDDEPFTPKFFGIDEDAWVCINCIANYFGGN